MPPESRFYDVWQYIDLTETYHIPDEWEGEDKPFLRGQDHDDLSPNQSDFRPFVFEQANTWSMN